MTERKVCVLVVAEKSGGAGEVAARLRKEGWRVAVASSLEAGKRAAERRPFDMVIFLWREGSSAEAEIIKAARARNSEVGIVREPGRSAKRNALEAAVEQLRIRQEVLVAGRRFQELLNGVFDGVVMVDVGSEAVTASNAAAAEALGYTQEEMEGKGVWELIPGDRSDDARRMFERTLKVGKVAADGLVLRRKDGEILHCRCNATLTGKASERVIQVVFRDVNEKRRLIQQLAEGAECFPLREVISGIVHEINNPLAAVLGYAQLCLTTASRKKLDQYLQTVHQQAGRCQGIVQKLSWFARRPEPHRKVTDLNGIVGEIVSLFACELRLGGVELKLDLCRSSLPVRVDPGQMQQVVVNVINNAMEAMGGSKARRLSVATRRCGDEGAVTVSDTGPGVPDNLRNKIFEPFFSTKPEKVGLGLSASRSIVNANQGEIEVLRGADKGATFRIRFPLEKETRPRVAGCINHARENLAADKGVMVVDDEVPLRSLVRRILTGVGGKADIALIPAQCRETIEGKEYDMVQIDVKLPGSDAGRVSRSLQESKPSVAENGAFCTEEDIEEETDRSLSGLDDWLMGRGCGFSLMCAVPRRVR